MESIAAVSIEGQGDANDSEQALIEAAKVQPARFEPLYQRYMPSVYRYLRTRLNSDEDAADLTQQVFLKALDALPHYHNRGLPFAAWLFRIARHVATDNYRRHKSAVSWDALPDIVATTDEHDPEAHVLHQERLAQLRDLLCELDPYKRELLALRFAAGPSTTEIAAVVGKKQEAVKKQLTRILHTLKEHYHEA